MFRATALALGLVVASGVATEAPALSPGHSQIRSGDFAVTAQRESTTVFRETAKSRSEEVGRSQVSSARVVSRTAAPVFKVFVGTNGTTADTARLTFTSVAQTAAIDTAPEYPSA